MAVQAPRLGRRQAGIALITALLVVALATIAAVAMARQQQLDIRRTGSVLDADQAQAYAEGVEGWARKILERDREDGEQDHLREAWATRLAPIEVEGGFVNGRIEDLQGRFNLNNLLLEDKTSERDVAYFRRLLELLELDPGLTDALLDWLDADQDLRFPDGAEDGEYLSLEPPYRPANRLMTSPSELAAVKGFTAAVVRKLAPLVTALPERTTLNVNTAPALVLQALHPDLNDGDVQALIDGRGDEGYASVDDFLKQEALAGREIEAGRLAVGSSFFLVRAEADIGTARSRLFCLVQRSQQGLITLARTRGIW